MCKYDTFCPVTSRKQVFASLDHKGIIFSETTVSNILNWMYSRESQWVDQEQRGRKEKRCGGRKKKNKLFHCPSLDIKFYTKDHKKIHEDGTHNTS